MLIIDDLGFVPFERALIADRYEHRANRSGVPGGTVNMFGGREADHGAGPPHIITHRSAPYGAPPHA